MSALTAPTIAKKTMHPASMSLRWPIASSSVLIEALYPVSIAQMRAMAMSDLSAVAMPHKRSMPKMTKAYGIGMPAIIGPRVR